MIERSVVVQNSMGIHARPAALLVQLVGQFESEVFFEKDGEKVNGRSIMGVMLLAAACNTTINVTAEGSDESEAMAAIEKLFEDGFGEE